MAYNNDWTVPRINPSAPSPADDTGGTDRIGSSDPADVDESIEEFCSRLSLDGIDLVHPTCALRYNRALAEWAAEEGAASAIASLKSLPTYGRKEESGCLTLILGNSRAIWCPFLRWLREDYPARLDLPDPLDAYVSRAVKSALSKSMDSHGIKRKIFWAWEIDPDRMVAIGRAADLAGMAHLDSTSHLSVHPTYGTWFSLRAVMVLDLPARTERESFPARRLKGLLSDEDRKLVAEAFNRALAASSVDLVELRGAGCLDGGEDASDSADAPRSEVWREWVALRDVVRTGREQYRFREDQIEYHYTKSKAVLRRSLSSG